MRIIALTALAASSLALAACGSAAPPAPAAAHAARSAPAAAPRPPAPSPSCTLPVAPSYLLRTAVPGTAPVVSEVGAADLADCTTTLSGFAATAGQAPGECDTIALASDNPQIDPYTSTAAPPLRDVIESAGPGC